MHSSSGGVVVSKKTLVIGGVVLAALILALAIVVGVLIGSGGGDAETSRPASDSPSASTPLPAKPRAAPASQPPVEEEPPLEAFRLGETFTTGNVTLTIHSIEPFDSIKTTSGSPLLPDTGGQLFLIKTTYSNSKNQADLSCGSADLYIKVFDTQEREMAQVFETSRVAGNPGCNDMLLQDTPHEWNIVFQSVAGAVPLAMSVVETDKWLDPVLIRFQ